MLMESLPRLSPAGKGEPKSVGNHDMLFPPPPPPHRAPYLRVAGENPSTPAAGVWLWHARGSPLAAGVLSLSSSSDVDVGEVAGDAAPHPATYPLAKLLVCPDPVRSLTLPGARSRTAPLPPLAVMRRGTGPTMAVACAGLLWLFDAGRCLLGESLAVLRSTLPGDMISIDPLSC